MLEPLVMPHLDAAGLRSPEIALAVAFALALPLSLLARGRWPWLARGVVAAGLAVATLLAGRWPAGPAAPPAGDDFHLDPSALVVRMAICAAALLVVVTGARGWRRPPGPGEVPARAQPFVALAALALCLLAQAGSLAGAVVGVMGAALAMNLAAGLCARTPRARAGVLRAALAATTASALAAYGLSLSYPLTGGTSLVAIPGDEPARAVVALTLLAIATLATATPALWSPGRADGEGGVPSVMTAFLGGAPVLAAAVLMWRLVLGGAAGGAGQGAWPGLYAGFATLALAAGGVGGLIARPADTRIAWLAVGQLGYAFLGLAAPASVGREPFLQHLAIVVVVGLGGFGLRQLAAASSRAPLTAGAAALLLAGLALLPLRLVLLLAPAGRPAVTAVAALGLLGSLGYLRLARRARAG